MCCLMQMTSLRNFRHAVSRCLIDAIKTISPSLSEACLPCFFSRQIFSLGGTMTTDCYSLLFRVHSLRRESFWKVLAKVSGKTPIGLAWVMR